MWMRGVSYGERYMRSMQNERGVQARVKPKVQAGIAKGAER